MISAASKPTLPADHDHVLSFINTKFSDKDRARLEEGLRKLRADAAISKARSRMRQRLSDGCPPSAITV